MNKFFVEMGLLIQGYRKHSFLFMLSKVAIKFFY